ncbi:hypothetical protein VCV18_006607 [Metarhizium anisopliae]
MSLQRTRPHLYYQLTLHGFASPKVQLAGRQHHQGSSSAIHLASTASYSQGTDLLGKKHNNYLSTYLVPTYLAVAGIFGTGRTYFTQVAPSLEIGPKVKS